MQNCCNSIKSVQLSMQHFCGLSKREIVVRREIIIAIIPCIANYSISRHKNGGQVESNTTVTFAVLDCFGLEEDILILIIML